MPYEDFENVGAPVADDATTAPADEDVVLGDEIDYVVEASYASGDPLYSDVETITLTGQRPAAPSITIENITRSGADLTLGAASSPIGLSILKREIWVTQVSDGTLIVPVTDLGAAPVFPYALSGLPFATELRAHARDWDTYGFGLTTTEDFTTLANAAPTAPVITSPADGSTIDLAGSLTLSGTTSTDADSDPITYFWERRLVGSTEWERLVTGATSPDAVWAPEEELEVGQHTFRLGAWDGYVMTWSAEVTVNAGFDTISQFDDFSSLAEDLVLATPDWRQSQLESFNPRAPRDGTIRRAAGSYGRRVLEYNCGSQTSIYNRLINGHWADYLGDFYRPVVRTRMRIRHSYTASPSSLKLHAGVFLCMGGDPLDHDLAKGYFISVQPGGVSGRAFEGSSTEKGLSVESNTIPYLKDNTFYEIEFAQLGVELQSKTVVKKSYLDYVAGTGTYDGHFTSVEVPTMPFRVRVYDDQSGALLGEATLRHTPSLPHSEYPFLNLLSLSGRVGFAHSDWPGSVQYDWIAARSLDPPVIPTEREVACERWLAPYFGEKVNPTFSPRFYPVRDPQARLALTRVERRNLEDAVPTWEVIYEATPVPAADGTVTLSEIDTALWRQSRGWQLALSHSFGDDIWSDRLLSQRFIVDRSGGTISTGFPEYPLLANPTDWIPVWRTVDVLPRETDGSSDGVAPSIAGGGLYSNGGRGWTSAGIREDAAIWATQRINSQQGYLGLFVRGVISPFIVYESLLRDNYSSSDKLKVGVRVDGGFTRSEDQSEVPVVFGADYHHLVEVETTAGGGVEIRAFIWRDEVQDEADAVTVTHVVPYKKYRNREGLFGIASGEAPIHGYASGARTKETDNVTVTMLTALPDDRPEIPDPGDPEGPPIPNPEQEENEPPPITLYEDCPTCPPLTRVEPASTLWGDVLA